MAGYRLTAVEKRYKTAWLLSQRAQFVAGVVAFALFAAAMTRYLARVERCACAQTNAENLRWLLRAAIGVFCVKVAAMLLDAFVYIPNSSAGAALVAVIAMGWLLDLALAATVMKWYAGTLDCDCSRSWERHAFFGASVLVALTTVAAFATGNARWAFYWMPQISGRVLPLGP
jgi:hypothetical protein